MRINLSRKAEGIDMLHSTEDTLQAYREVSCYTIDAIIEARDCLRKDIEKTKDSGLLDMLNKRLEKLDECLYIIGNDD